MEHTAAVLSSVNSVFYKRLKIIVLYDHSKSYQENRQDWRISRWLQNAIFTPEDLEKHPQVDSVIKLANVRDYLWERMNERERGVWSAYWGYVYSQKKPLKKKFWNKMNLIVKAIDDREQVRIYIKETRLKRTRKQGS